MDAGAHHRALVRRIVIAQGEQDADRHALESIDKAITLIRHLPLTPTATQALIDWIDEARAAIVRHL